MFRFLDADRLPSADVFLPDPDEIEERVTEQLDQSALFAAQFRENASRALLIPRMRPGARTPLWVSRLRSQNLHAVARNYPDFPIMLETFRSCLQDVFDLPGLVDLMAGIRAREICVDDVETRSPSPFARNLVFAYTATYLYQLDLPAAERRTQALALDRHMLRELLGAEALRELLDPTSSTGSKRAGRVSIPRPVPDTRTASTTCCAASGISRATRSRRASRETQRPRSTAARAAHRPDRAGRAHDLDRRRGSGSVSRCLRNRLARSAPGRLPLRASAARAVDHPLRADPRPVRDGAPGGSIRAGARSARAGPGVARVRGKLEAGEFDPRGRAPVGDPGDPAAHQARDPRTASRRDLSGPGHVLARFLVDWHGIDGDREGESRFDEVIDLLEGLPLSFAELERSILPARMPGDASRWLDERGAQGGSSGSVIAQSAKKTDASRSIDARTWRRSSSPTIRKRRRSPCRRSSARCWRDSKSAGLVLFRARARDRGRVGGDPREGALGSRLAGLVTNDTFAPLRALATRPAPGRRRGRRAPPTVTAGRWSLVSKLIVESPSGTEKLHARTLVYLDRHGIVSRSPWRSSRSSAVSGRSIRCFARWRRRGASAGAISSRAGRARSSRFRGSGSAARAARHAGGVARGAARRDGPGPALRHPTSIGRRLGASLAARWVPAVLVDGFATLFVDRGGERVLSFEDPATRKGEARIEQGLRTLVHSLSRLGKGRVEIREVDGEKPRSSALADLFPRAGFRPATGDSKRSATWRLMNVPRGCSAAADQRPEVAAPRAPSSAWRSSPPARSRAPSARRSPRAPCRR